jgi:tartrate-resistant acid phosphatase type 5
MSSTLLRPTRRELLAYGSATVAATAGSSPMLAGGARPLQFMVLGDWGREGAQHQRSVAAAMGEFGQSRFVVTTGDNFYQHGVDTVRDPKWDRSFQQIYTDVPQRWYAVLGNHDYGGRVEAQIQRTFHDPRWRMPDYWYEMRLDAYGRPDIHLFFINTVVWHGREKFPYNWLGSSVSKKQRRRQREWLVERLSASDAPVKLVFGHHPIYSVRTQGSYYGMPDLDALLFDHGATAYVNGHDHCMYHISAPDWRGKAPGRMHYICSGAGSEMRPVYPPCVPRGLVSQSGCVTREQLGPHEPFWHAFFTKSDNVSSLDLKGGFAVVDVQDTHMRVGFIEPVADAAAGRPWRERYAASVPIRIN